MKDDLEKRLLQVAKALERKKLRVGVPSGATQPAVKGKAPHLATIAYINEFGDEEMGIPPRPFLVPGIEAVKYEITKRMSGGAQKAFDGNLAGLDDGMHAAGLAAQFAVKQRLQEGPFTPLKLATIAARARRKVPDSDKLDNTASPRNARKYRKLQREGVPTEVLNEAGLARPLIDTRALFNSINYVVKG